jgi:hypothetical protein
MAYYCDNASGECIAAADLFVELCGAYNATECECGSAFGASDVAGLFVIVVLAAACVALGAKLHAALTQEYVFAEDLSDEL